MRPKRGGVRSRCGEYGLVVRGSAMRLAGYQPQYFPRLHYVARLLGSDVFVVSDTVQFVRSHRYPLEGGMFRRGRSYQADTPIKSSQGVQYLSVPVRHEGLRPINELQIAYEPGRWQEKHVRGIQFSYAGARYFAGLFPSLRAVVLRQYDTLADLNVATLLWALLYILGEPPAEAGLTLAAVNLLLARQRLFPLRRIVRRSALAGELRGSGQDANDTIIATCAALGADEYYCGGTAAAAYLDPVRFDRAGVRLVQQQWECQPYQQQFPERGFVANLSIIDLLFNEDVAAVRRILQPQMARVGA